MIIYLTNANFSTNKIGTLSTYLIRFDGAVTNSNTSVDRENNTGYTTTITLRTGYELDGSITVTMGGTDITSTAVSGLTITIPTKVTGNVVIKVPTKNTAINTMPISGTWTFNDTLVQPTFDFTQSLTTDVFEGISYYTTDGYLEFQVNTTYSKAYEFEGSDAGWTATGEGCKTFTIEGTQTISAALYNWIVANAVKSGTGGSDGGVTIDVSVRTTSNSHADALPAGTTSATNLWTTLTPEAKYYDSTGTYTTYNSVSSVVFPVKPGDKLTASSFGATKESNGVSHTGIRITYLLDNTVVNSLTADTVAAEYKSNGYVTVPSGVNAVNIPVWDNTVTGHEVYLFPVEAASGTPTKPSNYNSGSGSGSGGSGSGSGGNIEVEDTSGATWYVNHLANGSKCTASVNIAGRGWAHVPGSAAYNAYVGKPVNTIGFFTNMASQNVTIGKVVEKGGVEAMETIATVTAVNPSGTAKGFCYVTFPTVTLAEGECLAMFAQDDSSINFYYHGSGSLTDANGIVDTNFYGRVPKVYGAGTAWTAYPTQNICLGISVGYIAS